MIAIQLVYFQDLNVGINIWIKRNNIWRIHITHTTHVHEYVLLHFHCFKERSNIFLSKYENVFVVHILNTDLFFRLVLTTLFSFTIGVF